MTYAHQQIFWDFLFIDCCNSHYEFLCLFRFPLSEQPPRRLRNPPEMLWLVGNLIFLSGPVVFNIHCYCEVLGFLADCGQLVMTRRWVTVEMQHGETRKVNVPYVQENKGLRSCYHILRRSPVTDNIDEAGHGTLAKSCQLLTQTGC